MKDLKVISGKEASQEILKGVNKVADAVKVTFGPAGNNVIINRPQMVPFTTKDGVTVAKAYPEGYSFEDTGIALIKQVASNADKTSGDGTTTGTVLAQALMNESYKMIYESGKEVNRISLKRGIDKATEHIQEILETIRVTDITDDMLRNICKVSTNSDQEITDVLTDTFLKTGKSAGAIALSFGRNSKTYVEYNKGFQFETPFMDYRFVNMEGQGIYRIGNACVITYDDNIDSSSDIVHFINTHLKEDLGVLDSRDPKLNDTSYFILAREFSPSCISDIVGLQNMNPKIKVMLVRTHSVGENRTEIMKDFAALTGSVVFNRNNKASFKASYIGSIQSALQDKNNTVAEIITDSYVNDKAKEREGVIAELLKQQNLTPQDKSILEHRMANLSKGIANIFVGGYTETEVIEKLDRYQDAYNSLRAADLNGIVPGGGVALLQTSKILECKEDRYDNLNFSEKIGYTLVESILDVPFKQILINGDLDDKAIKDIRNQVIDSGFNKLYNLATESFEVINECNVIDPYNVTVSSLRNATSLASTFLSNKVIIMNDISIFDEERKKYD